MAHGVEARVPFLDPELVKTVFHIPLCIHYRNGERKALLKRTAAQYLPVEVLTPRKKGFSSPLWVWFDEHLDRWNQQLLDGGMLMQHGILRQDWSESLGTLLAEHPAIGARSRWLLLTAELWARRWIADSAPVAKSVFAPQEDKILNN
jgi:asparagine synthase (glutamine-hydrolysing)